VYSSGGFINAGSSVNGTADRYKYTATASQTTFSGADDNANTLAYDAGFLDVYLNGIKLVNGSDFTASSGTSIVLAVGASASDILEVIAYGTFQLANFSIADANDVPPLGTAGQVLKVNSGATALEYGTIDLTNLNASNLTSGTLPDARFPATLPATSGANLTSLNASNLSSGTVPTARLGTGTADATNFLRGDGTWSSAGIAWQSVQTSGFTAVAGRGYPCNTTSAAFTVTLPSSPSAGDEIIIVDYAGTFATNNLTITSTPKINGSTNDVKLTTNREATRLVYIDATQGYIAYSGVNEGTSPSLTDSPPNYSVDFLVIAGGGGGGRGQGLGGGGGAGGYRNSYLTETSGGGGSSETSLTFTQGIVYTITVGAGGAGGTSGNVGGTGVNSSISGSDITTITSSGGGGGGRGDVNDNALMAGASGGSGGGGGENQTNGGAGGSGTANQGFAGGTADAANVDAGGGGGAGEAGNTDRDGDGGDGLASSITGSSITRGGGGAGSSGDYAPTGGTGGGGNGFNYQSAGAAGTANTGGGGSGAYGPENGGAGGSGVVIIRMPTANYSGTTTGSPTVTTDGSDKVIVFNSSGTITG